ncbi:MAG: hypothetical protein ABRQ37_06280 [Candidatus Eremiobacterota bacterium]
MCKIWIDKEIIPLLIDAVEHEMKCLAGKNTGLTEDEDFDPNDYFIYNSFVLPVLKENKEKGFYCEEMLRKGFSFMLSLLPACLKKHKDTMDANLYGKMARIYYNYSLNNATSYVNSIDEKYIAENIENINKYIDLCKIDR